MRYKRTKFIISISAAILMILLLAAPVFAESGEGDVAEETPAAESGEGGTSETQEEPAPPAEEPVPSEETESDAQDPAAEETNADTEENGTVEEETAEPADQSEDEESESGETGAEPSEPAGTEVTASEPAAGETLAKELAETGLSLAAPDGESLDLASEETAAAVKAPDPYFTVGSTTYRFFEAGGVCASTYPGDPNCYDGEGGDVIQDAIDFIQTNGTIPTDRKIYVEGAHTYSGFTVNGSLANLSDIRGIIGVDGSENTTLTGNVVFHDLIGGFTLQGFTINGGVNGSFVTGTVTLKDLDITNGSGNGITLEANIDGAVVIEDVKSNNNSGAGADIDNQDNAKAYNVTVKNSAFDHNDDGVFNVFGLEIVTLGKVKLENVSASHNRGAGVSINSDFSSLIVEDASFVNNDNNPNHGAFDFGLLADTNAKATITLKNVYITDSNDTDEGLQLSTAGNVTLRNTYVERNAGGGAYIDNTLGTGYVKVYDSTFNENLTGSGLFIISNGTVYLSSIQANNNVSNGLFIDNCQQSGGACTGTKTVTVTSSASKGVFGANSFSDNGSFGLYIESGRNISLSNISANNNGIGGMYAITTIGSGSISLKKTVKSTDYIPYTNTAINNGDHGVYFNANGSITVEYLVASENDLAGAWLDNDDGSKTGNITIKYSEFTKNGRQGLAAYSSKNILLTNIIANENGLSGTYHGAYLYTLNSASGGVTLSSSKGFINQFNGNSQRGLYIDVVGNVKLKKLEANDNQSGLYVDAINAATSPRSVTISYGWFNNSTTGYGFEIDAEGSVKIDNTSANDNALGGGRIGLTYLKYPGTVSVKYSTFDRNDTGGSYDGLHIRNYKSTTLYAVSASENGDTGVTIDSCQWDGVECLGTGSVSIKSKKGVYNTFNDNGSDGLFVWASGSVSVSYVMAGNNDGDGFETSNSWDGSKGNVTISGNSATPNILYGNSNRGIYVSSNGTISAKYIEAFENMSGGAYFSNNSAPTAKKLTVVDSSFNKNEGTGLEVYSDGNITLQGVEASDNSIMNGSLDFNNGYIGDVLSHTYQVDEWTTNVPSTGAFTLTLESVFFDAYLEVFGPNGELLYSDDNSGGGSDALINGSFTDTGDHTIRVTAMDGGGGYYELNLNSDPGISQSYYRGVDASTSIGSGNVTVKYSPKRKFGLTAWNNSYTGLQISAAGAISVSRAEAMYNGYSGIYADNDHINEKTAKFTSVHIEGSEYYGLYLDSSGHITLSKVTSLNNLFNAAFIRNSTSTVPRYVKISKSVFSGTLDEFNDGLVIFASGAVTLSGVTAENPDAGTGVYIDNTYNDGQKVTISGKDNVFSNNGQKGVHVLSKGDISLSNFTAENNSDDGIYLHNGYGGITAQIKVSASKGFNDLVNNGNNGLSISTNGKITISRVNASNNAYGTYLGNGGSPSTVSVSVSNSTFNDGGDYGLDIFAHGKVTLNNITAANNTNSGVYLDNSGIAGEDVIIKKSQFFGNGVNGAYIVSEGFVNISYTSAFDNLLGEGIHVQNDAGVDGVSVYKGSFNNNNGNGLQLDTDGAVSIKNVDVIGNSQYGTYVTGDGTTTTVSLNSVNAAWNDLDGVRLDNVADVTVSLSNFVANGVPGQDSDGLYVYSNGSNVVTISKSTFMANFGNGIDLSNIGSYSLTSTLALGNDADGDNTASQVDVYVH